MDNKCVKYYPNPIAVRSYGPDTDFRFICIDTPLSYGQQLCEILSRSNMAMRGYGPDTDLGYVFTVTLTLKIWPWVKFMTHPWVMDNSCVKYYPDPTWQWGVIARTRILGMCSMTLTLEIWPWVKVLIHPWAMDNNCVKYYPDRIRG